jgi:hypothetical protein
MMLRIQSHELCFEPRLTRVVSTNHLIMEDESALFRKLDGQRS